MNTYTAQSFNLQIFRSLNSCAWSTIVNACADSSQQDHENIISRVSVLSRPPRRDTIGCRKNELTSADCRLCAKYWVIFHAFNHKKAAHGVRTFMFLMKWRGRVHSATKRYFFSPPSKNIWSSSASQPCMTNISVTEKTQVISGKGGRGGTCSRPTSEKKHNILLFNMCKHRKKRKISQF